MFKNKHIICIIYYIRHVLARMIDFHTKVSLFLALLLLLLLLVFVSKLSMSSISVRQSLSYDNEAKLLSWIYNHWFGTTWVPFEVDCRSTKIFMSRNIHTFWLRKTLFTHKQVNIAIIIQNFENFQTKFKLSLF